jgi:hypothetical protein
MFGHKFFTLYIAHLAGYGITLLQITLAQRPSWEAESQSRNLPRFFSILRFITVFTPAIHGTVTRARRIHFTFLPRHFLILSFHVGLELQSVVYSIQHVWHTKLLNFVHVLETALLLSFWRHICRHYHVWLKPQSRETYNAPVYMSDFWEFSGTHKLFPGMLTRTYGLKKRNDYRYHIA